MVAKRRTNDPYFPWEQRYKPSLSGERGVNDSGFSSAMGDGGGYLLPPARVMGTKSAWGEDCFKPDGLFEGDGIHTDEPFIPVEDALWAYLSGKEVEDDYSYVTSDWLPELESEPEEEEPLIPNPRDKRKMMTKYFDAAWQNWAEYGGSFVMEDNWTINRYWERWVILPEEEEVLIDIADSYSDSGLESLDESDYEYTDYREERLAKEFHMVWWLCLNERECKGGSRHNFGRKPSYKNVRRKSIRHLPVGGPEISDEYAHWEGWN